MPSISRVFFTAIVTLARETRDGGQRTLQDAVMQLKVSEERRQLLEWAESVEQCVWKDADLTPFAEEASKVARYSFRIERI